MSAMTQMIQQRRRHLVGEFLVRGGVFALAWWLLTHGDAGSWAIGGPTIAAAAGLSILLRPVRPPLPRLARLPGFLHYFARESMAGGIDVIKRALHPDVPLQPGLVSITVTRLDAPQRLIFAILVNLMPGTLSARLQGGMLIIHALDRRMPIEASLRRLEDRLADLLGRRHGMEGIR